MRIDSIQLENIRSHADTIIIFSTGFNCLVGGLGTGKSSLLYAIDFALFGEPIGRSYNYLLREDAETGKVILRFAKNRKEYTIQRALKRHRDRISQDFEHLELLEGDTPIAEIKSDAVAEQLRSVIGIERDIFREIIWVRQEHLKDILNMPPRERQKQLDQLFGLADYEASWTNLRPILSLYEGERKTLESDPDIVTIKKMQAEHKTLVEALAERDSEKARQVMAEQIRKSRDRVMEAIVGQELGPAVEI